MLRLAILGAAGTLAAALLPTLVNIVRVEIERAMERRRARKQED